jgi:Xaa-Pro aminopeptidase
MLKAGAFWDDIHLTAHELAIEGLLKLGILKGDKEEILKARTSVAFFPHGLGHYLGMDTHDTGGHANYKDEDSMFRYLRVRGNVPAGSVITVEPGVSLSITTRFLVSSEIFYFHGLTNNYRSTFAASSSNHISKTRHSQSI